VMPTVEHDLTLDDTSQCFQVEGCGLPNSLRQPRGSRQYYDPMLQERCAYPILQIARCLSPRTSASRMWMLHFYSTTVLLQPLLLDASTAAYPPY
jgi:hypothetical protein